MHMIPRLHSPVNSRRFPEISEARPSHNKELCSGLPQRCTRRGARLQAVIEHHDMN